VLLFVFHLYHPVVRAVAIPGPGGAKLPPPEKYFALPDEIRPLVFKIVIKKGKKY